MKSRFLKSKQQGRIFWHVSVYMGSVCLHVCAGAHAHAVLSYGSLRLISGVLLDCYHMLRQSLSLKLELTFLLVLLPIFLQGSSTSASHSGITCKCNAHLLPPPPTWGLHVGAMTTFYLCLPHWDYMWVQCPPSTFASQIGITCRCHAHLASM